MRSRRFRPLHRLPQSDQAFNPTHMVTKMTRLQSALMIIGFFTILVAPGLYTGIPRHDGAREEIAARIETLVQRIAEVD